LPEELLDLATDLDLVGQVELWIELVDEAVLDAVLRLAEGFPRGQRAEERPWGGLARWRRGDLARSSSRRRLARRGRGRNLRFPFGGGPRPLDPLQQRHVLNPSRQRRAKSPRLDGLSA